MERLLTPGATIPLHLEQQDAGLLRVLDVRLQTKGSQNDIIRTKPQSKTRSSGAAPAALACQDLETVSWKETVSASSGAMRRDKMIWDHSDIMTGDVIWDHEIADSSGSAHLVCLFCEIPENE